MYKNIGHGFQTSSKCVVVCIRHISDHNFSTSHCFTWSEEKNYQHVQCDKTNDKGAFRLGPLLDLDEIYLISFTPNGTSRGSDFQFFFNDVHDVPLDLNRQTCLGWKSYAGKKCSKKTQNPKKKNKKTKLRLVSVLRLNVSRSNIIAYIIKQTFL